MSKSTFHCHLDVASALKTFSNEKLSSLFEHDDGRNFSAQEARSHLVELLSRGYRALPFGNACDGFDFAGGGCPGHQKQMDDDRMGRGTC